jgi:uncharacterized membrane protein
MMSDRNAVRVHWSFWAIGAIALIWNAMGVINFFMQMNAVAVAAMPETQRAIIESRPAWATAAFAIAVFGGAFGCLLLLLKKSAATNLFIASLLGMVLQTIPNLGLLSSSIKLSPVEMSIMVIMPLAVAVFLLWYSIHAKHKRWIS